MRRDFVYGLIIGLMAAVLIAANWPNEVMQTPRPGRVTTGGEDTVSFTGGGAWDCSFENEGADAILLKFNGAASGFRLNGGKSYSSNTGLFPVLITSFTHTAVSGSPVLNYVCWER